MIFQYGSEPVLIHRILLGHNGKYNFSMLIDLNLILAAVLYKNHFNILTNHIPPLKIPPEPGFELFFDNWQFF